MYFTFNRRYNLLSVNDDFANLRSIAPNGDMEFEFFYRVRPQDAVSHHAMSVTVTVFSRSIQRKPLLENTHTGYINTKALVRNIIQQIPNAKSAVNQQGQFVIASRNSDISSRINNEIVGQLRANVPSNRIQQTYKSTLMLVKSSDVKEQADVKPVLTQIAHSVTSDIDTVHSSSIDENPTRLMYDMITRQGVDPSCILDLQPRSVSAIDAIGGILRPGGALEVENSPASRLLNYHIFPPEAQVRPSNTENVKDSSLVQVLVSSSQASVEIPVIIKIPKNSLVVDGQNNANLFVKFDLVNGTTGVAVDSVTKTLDVSRHVQLFNTPRRAPIVKVTKSEISTRANLEITQLDIGAQAVQVYRKQVFRAVTDIDDYSLVGTFNVSANQQPLLVPVDLLKNSSIIYRVIPVGNQETLGFEYTNVVIKPSHYRPIKSLALTAQPIDIGIRLEARQIPQHVVAIEFKVRNASTFETNFRNVAGDVLLVDDAIRAADYLTVIDTNVSPNNIYEYVVRLVYGSGTSERTGSTLIEFLQPTPGKVDTRIDAIVIDQTGDINVTFNINTTIINSDIDVIKALLEKQGIIDQFKGDVAAEREFLSSLIAHNVSRVNLTTGVRENFGTITTTSFSDLDLRKNQAITPLQLGKRYRYEVAAMLRAPETMFNSLVKEKIDPVTKKTYSYSPAKFQHPLALVQGVLVSAAGLKTRYSKDPMSHGTLGDVTSIEVSFDNDQASIIDQAASRFNRFLNIVTWKVQGSIDAIDFFLIMKDVLGVRTLVGKSHSEFVYGNCQYLHPVSRRDEGCFSYVIVPIFNDYKVGTQVTTNTVIVEPFSTSNGVIR